MILKIFSPNNLAQKLVFFAQTNASFCKKLIITLVFEKNANIFAENCDHNIDPRWKLTKQGPGSMLRSLFLAPFANSIFGGKNCHLSSKAKL
jgi:hypothetical protein